MSDNVRKGGKPQIVEGARLKPGRCAITGSSTGPFLDTGVDVRRYGRVYLKVRAIRQAFLDEGWLETSAVQRKVAMAEAEVRAAKADTEDARRFRELADMLSQVLPAPEPIINERVERVPRDPSDAEIGEYLARHPEVFDRYRPAPPGSRQEWEKLYQSPRATVVAEPMPNMPAAGPEGVGDTGANIGPEHLGEAPAEISVGGMTYQLDEVLDNSLKDIDLWLEGKPPEVLAALDARERARAGLADKEPRSGLTALLAKRGYDPDAGTPAGERDPQIGPPADVHADGGDDEGVIAADLEELQ